MRWINYKHRKPTDNNIPGWIPWAKADWDEWLLESKRLNAQLRRLAEDLQGLRLMGEDKLVELKLGERNAFIDDNDGHWGKLKPWLLAISHGKCWFTEGKEICSHFEVEHYRPKKVAKNLDKTQRDGYWWLAFEYGNYRIAGNVPNRKKGGWFPLHPKSLCSQFDAQCEESETQYLLDPIEQTDVDLLAFNDEGNAIPVPGTTDPWELERVDVSVKQLKLNEHDALPAARRTVWQAMTRAIDGFLEAKSKYRPGINPAPKAIMEETAWQIREMTKPEAELSSVALWCLRFRNDPQLLRLAA